MYPTPSPHQQQQQGGKPTQQAGQQGASPYLHHPHTHQQPMHPQHPASIHTVPMGHPSPYQQAHMSNSPLMYTSQQQYGQQQQQQPGGQRSQPQQPQYLAGQKREAYGPPSDSHPYYSTSPMDQMPRSTGSTSAEVRQPSSVASQHQQQQQQQHSSNPPPPSAQQQQLQQQQKRASLSNQGSLQHGAHAARNPQLLIQELDPVAAVKSLVSGDLRRAMLEFNQAADRLVGDKLHEQQLLKKQQQLEEGEAHSHQGMINDSIMEKPPASASARIAAPHSNAPLSVVGPLSVNPPSVINPSSVLGPQSVTAPRSVEDVKSHGGATTGSEGGGAPHSAMGGGMLSSVDEVLTPRENYVKCMNNFSNVCDDIEKHLAVIFELHRQMQKFESLSSVRTPADASNASNYTQLLQPYMDQMLSDKQLLKQNLADMGDLLARHRAATIPATAAAAEEVERDC